MPNATFYQGSLYLGGLEYEGRSSTGSDLSAIAANTLDTLGTLATPGGVEQSLRRVREPSPQTAKLSVASRGPWYTKKGSH